MSDKKKRNAARDGIKICADCGESYPATLEYFPPNKNLSYGVHSYCRRCHNKQTRESKRRNKARNAEYNRQYYQSHKEEFAERQRKDLANKPERFQSAVLRRRAKRRELPRDFTAQDWIRCKNYWNGCCCYCGNQAGFWNPISADHFIALSKGGGTITTNMIPACKSCNSSKHDDTPLDFLTRKLGKRKAKQKLAEIEAYFEWAKAQR